MVAVSLTVLVAALLINTLSYCSAENVYCVTPTATSCSSCPHNNHCATLSEYAQEAELYFTSNTTMLFLPGDHVLDVNITVANVSRLTTRGESSSDNIATVVPNGSVGFSFTNMVDLNIYSLAFTSYNRFWSYGSHPASNSALLLRSTQNAKLVECSFHDNIGTALAVLTFNGTNNFIKNSANNGGGAIYAETNSSLRFKGTSNFSHNSAYINGGGAIFTKDNGVLTFNGTSNFINNSANDFGGAIYAGTNTLLTFIGTSIFSDNSAHWVGGAIYIEINVVLNLNGTNNFTHNSAGYYGGAISTYDNADNVLIFTGTNNFIDNSVQRHGGGAISTSSAVLTFTGTSNFINNSANGLFSDGGAISTSPFGNAVLTFTGTNNFINNSAEWYGGAIYAESYSSLRFKGNFSHDSAYVHGGGAIFTEDNAVLGTSNFINNSALDGGAIYAGTNTLLMLIGTSIFSDNSAHWVGGAIYMKINVVLTLNGTNNFTHNSARYYGGAINTDDNADNVLIFTGTNNFIGNSVQRHGGGAISTSSAVLTFTGTNNFINNSANGLFSYGGAINTSPLGNAVLIFNGTNNFTSNSAILYGGVISTDFNTSLTFIGTTGFSNNSAGYNGGAIYADFNTYSLTFIGTTGFSNNTANRDGGAIYAETKTLLKFIGISDFITNKAPSGGAISTRDYVIITFTGTVSFISNSAMQGGAISANRNSKLIFDGNISYTNNGHNNTNADNGVSHGGAIYLALNSTFSLLPHTKVCWENNHATLGGAIYVSDINPLIYCTQIAQYIAAYLPREECFFQLPGQNLSKRIDVQLTFKNNSADAAGSVLYGGEIDNCKLNGLESSGSGEVFDMLFQYDDDIDNTTASKISSDPLYICVCKNNLPDCRRSWYHNIIIPYPVYPGELFQLSVPTVTVGQRRGTVFSTVRSTTSSIDSRPVHLLDYQYLQYTNNTCTKLYYTVFTLSQKVFIKLHAEGSPCSKYDDGALYFSLTINQTCPPGFDISTSAKSCVCEPRLEQYTNHCNITNGVGRITRDSNKQFWVGYDNSSHKLILHPYCPFDYCVNDPKTFPLNNTDIQCTYNRSGLLCGRCMEGYSLVLGSHQCRKCTNSHLALLIPFALMGVALVFLLLICKLTVATGTLSGLVFYANIVEVNHTIFLPVESTDALSVFIAWLNLDLGIKTCFYNGLDAYSKTWLQFVFPVYIWMLVALMILISHYSQSFAKLLGNNPVSVLATLILLSYTKILRTLIIAVYITYLEYPVNYNRKVWLYDANIDYLVGKHIPLFLVSVAVFLFLFLPYTLLLLFGQWLQAISHLRLFSWVNNARLKPFMDSYHAPYKAKHRYWPGLLLVFRFVFLLVFAFNHQRNFSINLLAIVVGAGILQLWAWVSGGVYKNWCLDALESLFMLNLIILAASTYHVKVSEGNKLAVGYTSVSITLGTLIVILFYHIFQQLRHTKLWKKVPKLNLKFNKLNTKQGENNPINDPAESVNLDQLREPWLEDLLQPTHSSL